MSCIIVAGEVIFGDLGTKHLTSLPEGIEASSIVLHDGSILLCGGYPNTKKCLKLDHGAWKEHSTLNQERYGHSAVTTQTATFLFGGKKSNSRKTYEYLPKGSTSWLMGKTEIPGGFFHGCAIAVKSDQEIWLIGGRNTEKRILSFNVNDHTFEELPFQLNIGRKGHKCAFIPNTKKIMITGGCILGRLPITSTEVLDTEDGSVTMASPMNSKRVDHGMGVLTIKGEDRLAVFGGYDDVPSYRNHGRTRLDSVETYNSQTEEWERSNIKWDAQTSYFGFLTVKLSNIISEFQWQTKKKFIFSHTLLTKIELQWQTEKRIFSHTFLTKIS